MRSRIGLIAAGALLACAAARADVDPVTRQLAHDIFKQLIEINTTDSVGSVTAASEAMAQRFRDAGFPESDIHLLGPTERTKNLVVRLRGTGKRKPVLLIAHLDVVEARREDWTTDPFQFVEQDGYYYGRGTQDMKDAVASYVTTLIRFRKEGYRPDRDIILALTAGEETGVNNGLKWLLANHRELVDADFVINHDDAGVYVDPGEPQVFQIVASEKIYADFQLEVTNAGGHSSLPAPENAIYQLAAGLERLARYEFPFELNSVTREYFVRSAKLASGEAAADMRAILKTPADPGAVLRVSKDPTNHSLTHTTCVATRLDAGHANNALPQMARAIVNCRILPGHTAEEVRRTLISVLVDPRITVRYRAETGELFDTAESKHGMVPPPLRKDVLRATTKVVRSFWPKATVLPMMAVGASDAIYANAAGLPVYLVSGQELSRNNVRSHGRDERLPVDAFYREVDFNYRFLKTLLAMH
jgi:acetylornithine deacetylase/succinyl-diaminopimelate desuccinylase-like protein